jgi:hypothetical protein
MAVRRWLAVPVTFFPLIPDQLASDDPRIAFWAPQMIAYRYTIEGEVTAANAAEAYDALTEVLAQIAESLELYAPQVELKKEVTITLMPLLDSDRAAGSRATEPPRLSDGCGRRAIR